MKLRLVTRARFCAGLGGALVPGDCAAALPFYPLTEQ